jgi:hypothetical protein
MNQAEAFRSLEEKKQQFLAQIPASAAKLRARYLKNQLEDAVEAAGKHLQAVYESGLEVGPDFGPLQGFAANLKYAFWLEGIHRHLRNCEAVLAEQPGSAPE